MKFISTVSHGFLLVLLMTGCDQIVSAMLNPTSPTSSEPPSLYLVLDDAEYLANQGSYCWTIDGMGLCADIFLPVYEPNQHHTINAYTFTLRFDEPLPTQAETSLSPGHQILPNLERISVSSTLNEDGTLTVRLPGFIEGEYVLDVFALWKDEEEGLFDGDSLYAIPVRISP